MAYFALVDTFSNAAGELVSERLVPEPIDYDEANFPPSPEGSPPRCFAPSPWSFLDGRKPKYLAYVPKRADPRFPYIRDEDRVRVEEREECEGCRNFERLGRKVGAEKPKKSIKKTSKERKLGEVDSLRKGAEDGPAPASREGELSGHSTAGHETSSKEEETAESVNRSQ